MAIFDIKAFAALKGQGQGTVDALSSSFGMPSCLTNLTKDLIRVLPTSVLTKIKDKNDAAADNADNCIKKGMKWVALNTSIAEWTTDHGDVTFISDSSKFGMDHDEAREPSMLGNILDTVDSVLGSGGQIYKNITDANSKIKDVSGCLAKYKESLEFEGGMAASKRDSIARNSPREAAEIFSSTYKSLKQTADNAKAFMAKSDSLDGMITDELILRQEDPDREGKFDLDFEADLSGFGFEFSLDGDDDSLEEEVFRLVFGPPKSMEGKFLLSSDGLYFDSQTSGIQPALLSLQNKEKELASENKWKFNYDANIGGRGTSVSQDKINSYVDTLFDPDIVDESKELQEYYKNDKLLDNIIGQKDKRILDLSAHISAYEGSGSSTAIITNTRQQVISEGAIFTDKINKRKKQIELAVKLPSIYGSGAVFSPGTIPVNDFSYMKDINVSVDIPSQKKLVLDQADVSSVVRPLPAQFVYSPTVTKGTNVDHLLIPDIGTGSIIYDDRDPAEVSGTTLSLTDVVVTDGLVAMYNFLKTSVVNPSSTEFLIPDDSSNNNTNNAQLVASDASSVFPKGLAIPLLKGITEHTPSGSGSEVSATGSYVRLPDVQELQDIMYGNDGFTIDTWLHMPSLSSADLSGWTENATSSLYRVILGNENIGLKSGASAQEDYTNLRDDFSAKVTRGFLMGFTRDRRITRNLPGSNFELDNHPASSLSFFLAPTQSNDASTAGFTVREEEGSCQAASSSGYRAMSISATEEVNNVRFDYLCSGFMHLAVSVDVKENNIKVYLDNNLMGTSSVTSVFGVEKGRPVNLPTFKQDNSFEYGSLGPSLDTFFTPWILGGGYTDGFSNGSKGNFMGGEFGGIRSGLNGHIGSFKLYNRPLSPSEVSINYNSQEKLFKNIDMPSLC